MRLIPIVAEPIRAFGISPALTWPEASFWLSADLKSQTPGENSGVFYIYRG